MISSLLLYPQLAVQLVC